MGETEKKLVGKVLNYYTNISVAIIELEDSLAVNNKISIEGATTKILQTVESMQIEHKAVEKANKGDSIGLKTAGRCRKGDNVFKIS
jgi:putative protease